MCPHANKQIVGGRRCKTQGQGGITDQAQDSHLEYSWAVSWEQPTKVESFLLYTLFVKLSSMLSVSFFLQDDMEYINKRKAISLVFSVKWDTFSQQQMWRFLRVDIVRLTNSHLICTTQLNNERAFCSTFPIRSMLWQLSVYCQKENNDVTV